MTPKKMIEQAALEWDIYLSHKEMDFLATKLPDDCPWDEEGMPIAIGMVIGFDACKFMK